MYGKVTEVIRTSGSARPNLKFSYDAAGRRITKAATWSGSTTYTFYTLDAQGNTLAMYSKTSLNSDLILEENLLYGSNRLGLHRRNKKLSFVAQTPTPVQVTRGQKRYELSNHLGNVHVVLSDRKKAECSGNTFTAYEPEIINTYDYYPFGMLMEERKGQKPECTTSSSATTKTPYNYGFSWLVDEGFAAVGTNVTLDQSTSALAVDRNSATTATGWGASKGGHNLVKGVTYTLSYQLQGAAPSGYTTTVGRTVQVRLKWGASVMASGTLTLTSAMQSGSFNYTADYTGAYTIEIVYTGAAIAKGRFLADNVKITYNSLLTTVNCGTAEKYLYGYNGKEKIDEQYGIEGTCYDYGFRVYDSRIAKFLSVDPLTKSFAWFSPYQFAGNMPIMCIDLDGLENMEVITHSQPANGTPGEAAINVTFDYYVATAGQNALIHPELLKPTEFKNFFSARDGEYFMKSLPSSGAEGQFLTDAEVRKVENGKAKFDYFKVQIKFDANLIVQSNFSKEDFLQLKFAEGGAGNVGIGIILAPVAGASMVENDVITLFNNTGLNAAGDVSPTGDFNFVYYNENWHFNLPDPKGIIGDKYLNETQVAIHGAGHNLLDKVHESNMNYENTQEGIQSNKQSLFKFTRENMKDLINSSDSRSNATYK